MATRRHSPPSSQLSHSPPHPSHTGTLKDAATSHQPPTSFPSLLQDLLPRTSLVSSCPARSNPTTNAAISSLQLHPTLEASLHILNSDLASAHFLVRKMAGPPTIEGMLLHGILHRIEGDFGNARAWVRDVADACAGWVPKHRGEQRLSEDVVREMGNGRNGGEGVGLLQFVYGDEGDEVVRLIDDVERLRSKKGDREKGDKETVESRARIEMEKLTEWCRSKFGEGKVLDASAAYVQPGAEVRKMGEDMVSGDKGWRKF